MKTITLSDPFMIPDALYARLEGDASNQGRTVEALLRDLVAAYLEELEDVADARAVLARIEAGESRKIPLDEIRARWG